MRERLDKAKALRRLFERQMDKTPDSLPHAQRQAQASKMMDALVGDQWRVEVSLPGVTVVAREALAAPTGPSSEAMEQSENNEFWCRVKKAMGSIGDHPDAIQYDDGQDAPDVKALRGLTKLQSKLSALIKSLS